MVSKEDKEAILNRYTKKEEKLLASFVIDKINKFENTGYVTFTYFLDLNEKQITIDILNKLKIKYNVFSPIQDISRFVVFLVPDYFNDNDIYEMYSKYITCIKVVGIKRQPFTHSQCMGTIYSLGIKREMLGDIFVFNKACYFFAFKSIEKYILSNLGKIAKIEVNTSILELNSDEIRNIHIDFKSVDIIVSSLRIDTILAEVFKLSRNEVKEKINKGYLYINSKEMYFVAYSVIQGDIISFKHFGKFKVGNVIRSTKSGKTVINIQKYS